MVGDIEMAVGYRLLERGHDLILNSARRIAIPNVGHFREPQKSRCLQHRCARLPRVTLKGMAHDGGRVELQDETPALGADRLH